MEFRLYHAATRGGESEKECQEYVFRRVYKDMVDFSRRYEMNLFRIALHYGCTASDRIEKLATYTVLKHRNDATTKKAGKLFPRLALAPILRQNASDEVDSMDFPPDNTETNLQMLAFHYSYQNIRLLRDYHSHLPVFIVVVFSHSDNTICTARFAVLHVHSFVR